MAETARVDERLPHSAARYACGCRCLFCTAAYTDRVAEVRRRPIKAAHGTWERLCGGCRCQACRHARREQGDG